MHSKQQNTAIILFLVLQLACSGLAFSSVLFGRQQQRLPLSATHASGDKRQPFPRELNSSDLFEREGDGLTVADQVLQKAFNFPNAPPMTVTKYETMQSRRVEVTIQYAGFAGYNLYASAAERIIKEHAPDVVMKRVVLPVTSTRPQGAFDVLVDEEIAYSKRRDRSSVYLQMQVIMEAIRKARKLRRKGNVVYGEMSTFPENGGAGGPSCAEDNNQASTTTLSITVDESAHSSTRSSSSSSNGVNESQQRAPEQVGVSQAPAVKSEEHAPKQIDISQAPVQSEERAPEQVSISQAPVKREEHAPEQVSISQAPVKSSSHHEHWQ